MCPYPQDVLTDLSSEPDIVSTCEDGDVYGHRVHSVLPTQPSIIPPLPPPPQGMMAGAHGVQLRLEKDEILTKAFRAFSVSFIIVQVFWQS